MKQSGPYGFYGRIRSAMKAAVGRIVTMTMAVTAGLLPIADVLYGAHKLAKLMVTVGAAATAVENTQLSDTLVLYAIIRAYEARYLVKHFIEDAHAAKKCLGQVRVRIWSVLRLIIWIATVASRAMNLIVRLVKNRGTRK